MIRNFLPILLNNFLYGDRKQYQGKFDTCDEDWVKWLKFYETFYHSTQKNGIGAVVNNWGYRVLNDLDLGDKTVLEIGPGNLPHEDYWNGTPSKYVVVDVKQEFLEICMQKLDAAGIDVETHLIERSEFADIPDESIDIILTFYSLEHIHNLQGIVKYFKQKLKTCGLLVGGIPNEGGLAWGIGRYLTSRRFVHNNSDINYDKIICWEHPNFCDQIFHEIERQGFKKRSKSGYPLGKFTPLDLNLISTFIYEKDNAQCR